MNKTVISGCWAACLSLLLNSCGSAENQEKPDTSDLLFLKSVALIKQYTDSINNCSDSLSLQYLIRNFDNKITALNFEFPPDTDLGMSEEENDSLITLFKQMKSLVNRRDSVIMNRIPVDSLTIISKRDSINNQSER